MQTWTVTLPDICAGLLSFRAHQTLMDGTGDKATAEGMELLRREVEKMKQELETAEEGLCSLVLALHYLN